MASKVPKFGAWEGGENYTVYFDNARKVKNNGVMINPNDPEENPAMFQAPPTRERVESQGQKSKVPNFGAWENTDSVGYTAYFENAHKTKSTGIPKAQNEPQLNQEMNPRREHETSEAQSKVPQFGAWEGEGEGEGEGEVAYTAYFDNVRKNKIATTETDKASDEPQLNRDVTPRKEPSAQVVHSKVPQFGAWEGGDNVGYTAYFDNARKNKDELVEPQMNRDVGERAESTHAAMKVRSVEQVDLGGNRYKYEQRRSRDEGKVKNVSRESTGSESHGKQGRETPGGLSPLHPKGGKQSRSTGRGSQTPERGSAIPQFGVWNKDPSQAEGFTGAFMRARDVRMTPINPASQPQRSDPEPKKGCCCPWF